MSKVTRLEVRNIKRISLARVDFKDGMTVVGGENDQGKSSFLDSLSYVFGGKKLVPKQPIKKGEDTAVIRADITGNENPFIPDCTVVRTFYRKGDKIGSSMEILESGTGAPSPSPQKILDDLLTSMAFDPLAFDRLSGKDQVSMLLDVVGLNVEEIDKKIDAAFAERKAAKAEHQRIAGSLTRLPFHADAPESEVSVIDLVRSRDKMVGENNDAKAKLDSLRSDHKKLLEDCEEAKKNIDSNLAQIEQLHKEIEDLSKFRAESIAKLDGFNKAIAETQIPNSEDLISEIDGKIEGIDALNSKVRQNIRHREEAELEAAARLHVEKLDNTVDSLRAEKKSMLESADWPVAGLGFDANGVTFNGLPLSQESASNRLKISTKLGLSRNKNGLNILIIRDGSLLGKDRLREVAEIAAEENAQVFVERVGEGEECDFIMRDGEIFSASEIKSDMDSTDPDNMDLIS